MLESLPWVPRTDLLIGRLGGTQIEERAHHLVVRTPENPWYHWGNFIQVTSGNTSDADHWLGLFSAEFPAATYRAIGLPTAPDPAPWTARGLAIDTEQALANSTAPHVGNPPVGYVVRQVQGTDWPAYLDHRIRMDETEPHPPHHAEFLEAKLQRYERLSDAGQAGFFAAWSGAEIVASLGLILLGDFARYQTVVTELPHRHHGLATYLLSLAAQWAWDRGTPTRIIAADAGSPAQALYERLGFIPLDLSYGAYVADTAVNPA